MYGSKPSGSPLNGLRLWSDWNSQLYQWVRSVTSSKEKYEEIAPKHSGPASFSYMALHMEDLMHPTLSIRFRAIVHLAEWVGSSLTEDQLCCLANQDSNFMGSHDPDAGKNKAFVKPSERYGKWRQRVQDNNWLKEQLHIVGNTGLKMLGYEPMRKLADPEATTKSGYRCTNISPTCSPDFYPSQNRLSSASTSCIMTAGVDYVGGDIPLFAGKVFTKGPVECCQTCKASTICKFFTYIKYNRDTEGSCYLKSATGTARENSDTSRIVVSGEIQ